jgi:sulfate permease, SulP family
MLRRVSPLVRLTQERGLLQATKEAFVPALAVLFMLVPQSLAYAVLAGVPPIYGLYSSTVPLLVYSLFGTSGQVAIGPVAMMSLLTAGAIENLGGARAEADTIYLVHALAFLVGVSSILLGLLRLGGITQLLSHEVLGGFTAAAAVIISFSQMKYVLGVKVASHHYPVETIVDVLSQLPNTNFSELGIALVSMMVLLGLKWWKAKYGKQAETGKKGKMFAIMLALSKFSALIVVAGSSLLAAGLLSAGSTVRVVGEQPAGIPAPIFIFSNARVLSTLPELILPALMISLIGFAETYAVGKVYDQEGTIVPNQELLAIGLSNVLGSFFNAIPVAGSFGRTAVNASSGSKTPLSGLFSGLGVVLILLLLSPIIVYVPYSGLAAVIIVAVSGLIKIDVFKQAWRVNRADFSVLVTSFIGTLALGVELGLACGTVFSILMIIHDSATPNIASLGQVSLVEKSSSKSEGRQLQWRDKARYPHATTPGGILILRMDRSIFFANCSVLEVTLWNEFEKKSKDGPVTKIILDLSAVNRIDLSGLHMLTHLEEKLRKRGGVLVFTRVKGAVRDLFDRWRLSAGTHLRVFHSIEDGIDGTDTVVICSENSNEIDVAIGIKDAVE